MFTDTMKSIVKSKNGNQYAQIYCTNDGWSRVYPMKSKSEAHETLGLLFATEGVPHTMISDGAKEETLGEFKRKASQADCRIKATEPYSPWSNAAEGSIRELKKGAARKILESGSSKKLWDHCMELEGLIRSHTAQAMYQLMDQTPEGRVKGDTPDVSSFSGIAWYEWVL